MINDKKWPLIGVLTRLPVCLRLSLPACLSVRKQDIIKVTEQLIEAISNGDFESYTYVTPETLILKVPLWY